jgi:hypothetical protein
MKPIILKIEMCDGQPYFFLVAQEENAITATNAIVIILNVFFFILL